MKRLITRAGAVTTVQMDGYLIEERLLINSMMIQMSDMGDGIWRSPLITGIGAICHSSLPRSTLNG